MEALGAPPEFREHVQATRPAGEFEVLPENATALDVFLRMATQWIVAPMGGAIGMNYQSLRWLIEMKVPDAERDGVFDGLQVMEAAALEVINERAAS